MLPRRPRRETTLATHQLPVLAVHLVPRLVGSRELVVYYCHSRYRRFETPTGGMGRAGGRALSSSSDEDEPTPPSARSRDWEEAHRSHAAVKSNDRARGRELEEGKSTALSARVDVVERMAQSLRARHGSNAAERFSFQQRIQKPTARPHTNGDADRVVLVGQSARAAAKAWPESRWQASDNEIVASYGLGMTKHMQTIVDEAAPDEDTTPELVNGNLFEFGIFNRNVCSTATA